MFMRCVVAGAATCGSGGAMEDDMGLKRSSMGEKRARVRARSPRAGPAMARRASVTG
jgi:hypothetical protein